MPDKYIIYYNEGKIITNDLCNKMINCELSFYIYGRRDVYNENSIIYKMRDRRWARWYVDANILIKVNKKRLNFFNKLILTQKILSTQYYFLPKFKKIHLKKINYIIKTAFINYLTDK